MTQHASVQTPKVSTMEDWQVAVERISAGALRGMTDASWGVFICLAVTLFSSGWVAKVAVCLTVLCAMCWLWQMVDQVCSHWVLAMLQCREHLDKNNEGGAHGP